jgi:hypothetical protein
MKSKRRGKQPQPRPRYIHNPEAYLLDIPTGCRSRRLVAEVYPGHVRFIRTFLDEGIERRACDVDIPLDGLADVFERSKTRRGPR